MTKIPTLDDNQTPFRNEIDVYPKRIFMLSIKCHPYVYIVQFVSGAAAVFGTRRESSSGQDRLVNRV